MELYYWLAAILMGLIGSVFFKFFLQISLKIPSFSSQFKHLETRLSTEEEKLRQAKFIKAWIYVLVGTLVSILILTPHEVSFYSLVITVFCAYGLFSDSWKTKNQYGILLSSSILVLIIIPIILNQVNKIDTNIPILLIILLVIFSGFVLRKLD